MQFHWTEYMSGDLEEAITLLKGFWWNISIIQHDNKWFVLEGDQPVLQVNTQDEAKAFVLGLAFSFVVLPAEIQEELKKLYSP